MPDDLLEMMAELDEIIGKTPSVGKLEESFDEPLFISVMHVEGRTHEPSPSTIAPRSRPPCKRTRELIIVGDLGRVKTPSVGMFKDDNLLGFMCHIVFGPSRYKLWWKELSAICDMSSLFRRSMLVVMMWRTRRPRRMKAVPGFTLDSVRKSLGTKFQVLIVPVRTQSPLGRDRCFYHFIKATQQRCATAIEMLYGAHKEERSFTFVCIYITS
ncbi:hypothetical protein L1987_68769 [Smallanthus sonchifolius]|uniref:Uncharacterized protein n=1 Tax=Smallanthus sonchifolius TaxID=185202 RepID=A0ACB9B5S7_9ASTR|nr:hypothetical protein L1987_68769 [Smallanthus sonchifolius]